MSANDPCAMPIDADVLMDYWLAILPAPEEEAVETHLLACDRCGERLRETIALVDGLRSLARSGALQVIVGDRLVGRATETGRRVREYAPPSGDSVQCTVSAEDDLLLAYLVADLRDATRVDLSWCDPPDVERTRMPDIPVRADVGHVICQQAIVWAKRAPSGSMTARLLAVDGAGSERVIGEYTFHHTRTIPGPPGWR